MKKDMKDNFIVPTQKLRFSPNNNRIFVRRDDLYPVAFGGNKARKAEIFFEHILSINSDTVVTYGSSSSNHCRAVACLAGRFGLDCVIVSPKEQHHSTSNRTMSEIFGAKTVECELDKVSNTIDDLMDKLRLDNKKPYFIYGGGHGNLGTLAYRRVFDEIVEFENKNDVKFDYIFHASGTGTTQAGLVSGKIESNHSVKIVGISIARKNPRGKDVVIESVNDFLKIVNAGEYVEFTDDYISGGYGEYTLDQIGLMKKMLIEEGLPLDCTYTGKAFWGMTEYIKNLGIFDKNILFIHTGGTPLFFDELEKFI